jgi:hypothetical protein
MCADGTMPKVRLAVAVEALKPRQLHPRRGQTWRGWQLKRAKGQRAVIVAVEKSKLGKLMRQSWKNSLMARQIIEKAIKSLHERKSNSFGLLPVSVTTQPLCLGTNRQGQNL